VFHTPTILQYKQSPRTQPVPYHVSSMLEILQLSISVAGLPSNRGVAG